MKLLKNIQNLLFVLDKAVYFFSRVFLFSVVLIRLPYSYLLMRTKPSDRPKLMFSRNRYVSSDLCRATNLQICLSNRPYTPHGIIRQMRTCVRPVKSPACWAAVFSLSSKVSFRRRDWKNVSIRCFLNVTDWTSCIFELY